MKLRVLVTPKPGVLDPEGRAVQRALGDLGYDLVTDVRTGKVIELELAESDAHVFCYDGAFCAEEEEHVAGEDVDGFEVARRFEHDPLHAGAYAAARNDDVPALEDRLELRGGDALNPSSPNGGKRSVVSQASATTERCPPFNTPASGNFLSGER